MPSAEERFRAKIVRRRGHEVWTGFVDHRGVGMVRIDSKLRTVQRAAWEFAYGPLPEGARINTCAGERACVRVDHLSLTTTSSTAKVSSRGLRRPKGSGSVRQLRPGVWQVVVSDGTRTDGRGRRRSTTVHGDRSDADRTAANLASRVRVDLGDLRVRELVGRLIEEHARDGDGGVERDRQVLRDIIEPAIGDSLAAELSGADVERTLHPVYRSLGADQTRLALGLLRDAYRWAIRQRWCDDDPTTGITIRTLM